MKSLWRTVLLAAALLPARGGAQEKVDALAVAKEVAATRFAGFSYGADRSRKQIDCVQFTGAVVEALLRRALTKEETDALYIRYPFEDLPAAVAASDPRTKGIQRALVDLIKRGTAVATAQVQAGDFVQYWIKGQNGKWSGHSALVTRVFTDAEGPAGIAIYSSNKSTNGIAEMDFGGSGLSLRKADRRFYFVRISAAAAATAP